MCLCSFRSVTIGRRAKSVLHVDPADGTCTQFVGKKLWVLVDVDEAAANGIEVLRVDPMKDNPPGIHSFEDWEKCKSFRWCILNEGDTIIQPRNFLHAVSCIGDTDSISAGGYCWLAGTRAYVTFSRLKMLVTHAPRTASSPPLICSRCSASIVLHR